MTTSARDAEAQPPARTRLREAEAFERVWLVADRRRIGPMTFEDALRRLADLHAAGTELRLLSIVAAGPASARRSRSRRPQSADC